MGDFMLLETEEGINRSTNSPPGDRMQASPMTSTQKLLYLLSSPSRYVQKKLKAGGLAGSIFTILASTVGAGILSLPYVMSLAGLYQGIIIFILGMIVSLYSCQLLVLAAEKTGKLTYESIGAELYGPKMRKFAEVNMIFNNYGTVIGYIVLLKDLVPNSLNLLGVNDSVLNSSYLWGCIITTTIVYPLSLKKEISSLRYTSLVSTLSCIYLSIAIMYSFFSETSDTNSAFEDAPAAEFKIYNILTAISIVIFSFMCHPNVIPIYEELERRSVKRGFRFLSRGLIMVLLLYLLVGIFGYLTFYNDYHNETKFPAQILQCKYSSGNIPIIIVSYKQASIAISITVLCGTPLLVHPCRDATLSLLYERRPTKKQYFIVVTSQVFSALGIALVIPSISYVLTVIGTISSPVICFVLPCLYYIKAFPGKYTRRDLLLAWFVMIFMSLIGVAGFIMFWLEIFLLG